MKHVRLAVDVEFGAGPNPGRIEIDGARAIGDRGNDLHRRPQARRARQRNRVQSEIEHLLAVARIQDGHVQIHQGGVTARRQRRRFGQRIIAHQGHCAAHVTGARKYGVAQRVGGAVEPWSLAVPEPHDSVIARSGDT